MSAERTLLTLTRPSYDSSLASIAQRLRDLADQVEREGRVHDHSRSFGGGLPHTEAAASVVHALSWGFANLNVNGLVSSAAVCDSAWADENPLEES